MSELRKVAPSTYEIPQEGGMKVPGLIIAADEFLQDSAIEQPLNQVKNVAHLPGIVGYSIAMPDIHWGYGFPIGGVAAMDEEGVISPGGVGYDINCGVRLAIWNQPFHQLSDSDQEKLLKSIFENVPSGVGRGHSEEKGLTDDDYKQIIEKGVRWLIEQGFGLPEDIDHIESNGWIDGGSLDAISQRARERGVQQLGSIGSGNHFAEIGRVENIFLPEIAKAWKIEKDSTYILIHSGSRGFGHQVCQDTLNDFVKKGYAENLPDRQLVAAPIKSEEGQRYFQAMAAAANFAFNNRQRILHSIRQSFKDVLGVSAQELRLIYDVCHNIAKFEEYEVEGVMKRLCVHRKGATRAFGPGAKELNSVYRETGQPVMVPGDMGTASHLMVGMGNPKTWCSSCHGAGRAKSRHQSMKAWKGKDLVEHMKKEGVRVMATSHRTIGEEMPDAYKDVDAVVKAVEEASLAKRVARLIPHLVLKG